jgi:hypothetical protein
MREILLLKKSASAILKDCRPPDTSPNGLNKPRISNRAIFG